MKLSFHTPQKKEKKGNARFWILSAAAVSMAAVLLLRFWQLQIVDGAYYQENYTLRILRERTFRGTRGRILDRNGQALADNRVSYTITASDNGRYADTEERNQTLNATLERVLNILEENGDTIVNDFGIRQEEDGSYSYTSEGTARLRFLADVFGHADISELGYNESLGGREDEAEAAQVMEYLASPEMFGIDSSSEHAYELTVLRYGMWLNNYRRYLPTTVAADVSERTQAAVLEGAEGLPGIELVESTVRVYPDSPYFSHITGYTGAVTQEELEEFNQDGETYDSSDTVGRSGMEQVLEETLQGERAVEQIYVDNVGRTLEEEGYTPPEAGQDVQLTIDADLQRAVYELIEQQLAGVLYSKIENRLTYEAADGTQASDLVIPVGDVYFALLDNGVLTEADFALAEPGTAQGRIAQLYEQETAGISEQLLEKLAEEYDIPVGEEDAAWQDYLYGTMDILAQNGILDSDRINRDDPVYLQWQDGSITAGEYLHHCVSEGWISLEGLELEEAYVDAREAVRFLGSYLSEEALQNEEFRMLVYRHLVQDGRLEASWLCMALLEQGVLDWNEEEYQALDGGEVSAYSYITEKIRDLEITPAQLALDPCTGSCVILDVKTGEVLACVTYPGYDSNRLANGMDGAYYNSLLEDASLPLYNNATQQLTAPGSTFKPVTAAAALTEGVVTEETQIRDQGIFTQITPSPACWIYPGGTHGNITIAEAIRDSCNYFFYDVAYRMSLENGVYQEEKGTATLQEYARLFGLGEETGIEIGEVQSQISQEYPVVSAIGQGNHNYSTVALARYAAAIASRGNIYRLSLIDDGTDRLLRQIDQIQPSTWDVIWSGMHMAAEGYSSFADFPIEVAGKTGTAEQMRSRPNHAVFIGFAPYDEPEIALSVRIAYGYTSSNAAQVAANVMRYYFGLEEEDALLERQAEEVENVGNVFMD